MSKKLLIAVLSLMFCSFGMATADIGKVDIFEEGGAQAAADRARPVNPDAPGFSEQLKLDVAADMDALQRPNKEPLEPTVFWPPDYYCDYINTCGEIAWFWLCPDEYPAFLTRMTVDAEGFTCTLKTAYVAVYPDEFVGTPDLIVEVRDGDLQTVRGSVTIPFASLPTTEGYVTIDLTSIAGLVYNHEERFTITIVDPGGGNTMALLTDDGGHGGNVLIVFTGSGFGWWGADGYNMDIGVDLCYGDIPYSSCVRTNYLCVEAELLGWYVWSNWSLDGTYAYPKTHYFTEYNVAMPCTLTAVGIASFGSAAWGYGSFTHGIDWMVCGGDGTGWPDTTDVYESGTIAWDACVYTDETQYGAGVPATYNHIPMTSEVLVDHTAPFYVVFNISGTSIDPAYVPGGAGGVHYWLSDEQECGAGGKIGFNLLDHPDFGVDPEVTLGWMTFFDYYGGNFNLAMYIDVCEDEFAVCKQFKNYCDDQYWYWLAIGRPITRRGLYNQFNPIGLGCRVENVHIAFGDASYSMWGDPPLSYTEDVYLVVRDNNGTAYPGDVYGDSVLIPVSDWYHNAGGDYTLPPFLYTIDIADQNIRFDGPIFVGVSAGGITDPETAPYLVADGGACDAGLSWVHYPDDPDGPFIQSGDWWGPDYPLGFWIHIDVCCVPPPERDCEAFVGGDWPTAGHDFRRTGASWNSTGDARCKQYLSWMHSDAVDVFGYSRPVIYENLLIVAYDTKLQCFDIAASDVAGSSQLLWTITGMPIIGVGLRNSVTVHNGYVYFGGGNAMSFNRADVYTGSDTDADTYGMDLDGFGVPVDPGAWTRNVINGMGMAGNTSNTASVILNVEGTDVLFVASEGGDLYAIDAATGADYAGWTAANPVMLDGNVWSSISSNGIDVLYLGTAGTGAGGTLYAVDAATGLVNWTVVAADDLYGHELDHADDETAADSTQFTEEFFQGPVAVDMLYGDGDLYFRTSFDYPNEVGGAPSGARYKLDKNGTVVWYGNGRSYWQSGNASISSPVLDANFAYFTAIPTWTNGSAQTTSIVKESGAEAWQLDAFYNGRCYVEGALDCRMLEADIYYQPNTSGQFLAIETADGGVVFEYSYDPATSYQGVGVALDPTHVIFTNYDGDIYCFMEGTEDRARLRILKTDELVSVPFFSPDPFAVVYEEVFMNNGCTNLTGSLEANEPTSTSILVTGVEPSRMDRMMDLADQMITTSYPVMSKTVALDMNSYNSFENSPLSKDNYSNMAAYAKPAWLNEIVVTTFDLDEGETFDVEYSVNGPLVTRGPHRCYVTIFTDNDDFFINDPAASPVVQLGVLGGCLEDGVDLTFGETSQNVVYVDNTGEFSNQDQTHMSIDGNSAAYWQGSLLVSASQYSQAFSCDDWGGNVDYWNTLLPDINCFEQCEPEMDGPVVLGYMWDGATYAPIEGYYAASTFIDSAINYDCFGTGWDWDNIDCPFDNSLTMGLSFDEVAYGAIGSADLNNFVVYRLDVTNRNAVATPEIFFGNLTDWDLEANGTDVFFMDDNTSIIWGGSCAASDTLDTWVYGWGVIPMKAGQTRVRTLDADQAMWHADNVTLDSAYFYSSDPAYAGATYQSIGYPGVCNASSDREAYSTFTSHTFAANETFSFGYYVFGFNNADFHDVARYTALARLVNAWAGFGRGDIDADGLITLADNTALYNMVFNAGPGPLFQHTADVDGVPGVGAGDVSALADYWWGDGVLVEGWILPDPCPTP